MNKGIKIVVAGPRGKMGKETIDMILHTPSFQLVGLLDRIIDDSIDNRLINLTVYTDAKKCFLETKPDVYIDFTVAEAAFEYAKIALSLGVRAVIGTTGLKDEQLEELMELSEKTKTACIVAPNFAIGAILMMKFSQMAAKFFHQAEIIEMHHDQKKDAPSGTAIKTATIIHHERGNVTREKTDEKEIVEGSRGANVHGIQVHSVRLPGLIAHQEVIFGSEGEILTIRHDTFNRKSFMEGVKMAVRASLNLDGYVYGLENLLT